MSRCIETVMVVELGREREPGWDDLEDVLKGKGQERWLFRPCDACGDSYRVWGTQVDLYPYCGGVKCKRDK
jgi:hypothetical protein